MVARIFGTTKPPFSGGFADACRASVSTYQSARAHSGFHGHVPGRWAFLGGKHGVLCQECGPGRGRKGPLWDGVYPGKIGCASTLVICGEHSETMPVGYKVTCALQSRTGMSLLFCTSVGAANRVAGVQARVYQPCGAGWAVSRAAGRCPACREMEARSGICRNDVVCRR